MYLRCRRCGVQTPGWDVSVPVRHSPTHNPTHNPTYNLAPPPLRLLLDDPEPQLP